MNITFISLFQNENFPSDTMWTSRGAEIVGYSPSKNEHIVIEDGMCRSENGKYHVHKYKPDAERFADVWQHYKYLGKDHKIFEDWVQF